MRQHARGRQHHTSNNGRVTVRRTKRLKVRSCLESRRNDHQPARSERVDNQTFGYEITFVLVLPRGLVWYAFF